MNLDALTRLLVEHGATRAYVKWLAENDNSKNQIYCGGGFAAIGVLPVGAVRAEPSGKDGRQVFKCPIDLAWITPEGQVSPAPRAQLILYPQYPEVRLSGFLRGSQHAPNQVLSGRARGRVLVLGITTNERVLGFAAGSEHPVAREISQTVPAGADVFVPLPLTGQLGEDTRSLLVRALRSIHERGWLDSKRLTSDGTVVPCNAENCGGFTLEAELGVRPNSLAEPDYLGWEVKQVSVESFERLTGTLTLMTPEPDAGYYATEGVQAFIRRFGYQDRAGRADRLNFGGVHRVGLRTPITRLKLELQGYDPGAGRITDAQGGICLVDDDEFVAAKWSFAKLIAHWKRKHARAAYVFSRRRLSPRRQYYYGPKVRLGEGTDFLFLLRTLESGTAYYDPGIKLVGASGPRPETKRRSQFRMRLQHLGQLYRTFDLVDLAS